MRPSGLLLSVIVHSAAIGTAVVAGGVAMARQLRVAPHVELQSTPDVAAAQPPALDLPPVVTESPREVPEATAPELVRDLPAPPELAAAACAEQGPAPQVPVPWRERVVRPAASVAAPPAPPVPAEPAAAAPVPAPVAPPSARVDARPHADNAPPEYPANERALGREGDVLVRVQLDEHGAVLGVELAQASPYAGLNRAALRAVRGWRFVPASESGRPIASALEVPVVFRLVAQ